MIFLLCDLSPTATFGKINLKNLQKLQKLDISGDDFISASGLTKSDKLKFAIHDQISHKAIPQSVGRYIKDYNKTAYTSSARKQPFLPLANTNNQLKKSKILKDDNVQQQYNSEIERLADSVEGRYRNYPIMGGLGKALRKKKLTKAQQIATNMQESKTIERLMLNPKTPPTLDDVKSLIKEAKQENRSKKQQTKKIKGQKDIPKSIEEKKYSIKERRYDRLING